MATLAKPETLGAGVEMVTMAIDSSIPEQHLEKICVLLAGRGYTHQEFQFAVNEMIGDSDLRKTLSFPDTHIELADFEKHIRRLREAHAVLSLPLTQRDITKLIRQFPTYLQAEHFHPAGTNEFEAPVYRYNPR